MQAAFSVATLLAGLAVLTLIIKTAVDVEDEPNASH